VDLATYFLRRGYDLVRPGGELCFITTNSIAEGDTLTAGLAAIVDNWGGAVVDALRSQRWEGSATVSVSVVHLHHGAWSGSRTLDGKEVETISASLTTGAGGTAVPLAENGGLISKGSNPLGTGFQLDAEEAGRLLAAESRNAEVVKPLYGSIDVTQAVDTSPRRWIIDFGGRDVDQAATYPEPFAIVSTRVKGERLARDGAGEFRVRRRAYRERWWQFAERSARLYERIESHGLARVIAMPEVSKCMLPAFLPAGSVVYFQTLFIISSDSEELFGLLTSSFHWLWAARSGGASSLETRPRYHQERCFETFPRPGLSAAVAVAARTLDAHRSTMMLERAVGMTDIYNLVTSPDEHAGDVTELRTCHQHLDAAIATAYGWEDLDITLGLHPTERFGARWTLRPESQREVERRLLELNSERHSRS
jgi:hypothetical protein